MGATKTNLISRFVLLSCAAPSTLTKRAQLSPLLATFFSAACEVPYSCPSTSVCSAKSPRPMRVRMRSMGTKK